MERLATQAVPGAPDKSPEKIARMFDAIARRYDLLNHLLSLGIDRRWRRRAIRELALGPDSRVLDLCTGTGDLALAVLEGPPKGGHYNRVQGPPEGGHYNRVQGPPEGGHYNRVQGPPEGGHYKVVGIDFSAEMLRFGGEKLQRLGERRVALVRGDAMQIPLPDESVDAVTIGFGIRNVQRPEVAAREIRRVLKPGGRLAILEFGTPAIPGVRAAYLFYFRRILPLVGRLVSRHHEAYSYLPASVAVFPSPHEFLALLREAGLHDVRADSLTLGVVYLFMARK